MKKFFTKNLGLKITSLILAILLEWYFFSPDNSQTVMLSAMIRLRNLQPSMMVVWPPGAERGLLTKVRVRGPSSLVNQLEREDHEFVVDLPVPTPPEFEFQLGSDQLYLDHRIDVLEIDPASIELKMERVVKKQLLVVVDKAGALTRGYRISQVRVFPETGFAQGPRSELEGLATIMTQPVDVSGFEKSRSLQVPLIDKGRLTNLKVNVVRVEVEILPIEAERALDSIAVRVLAPEGYAAIVAPSSVKLVLAGPQNVLDSLEEGGLHFTADARKLAAGQHNIRLKIDLPSVVSIVNPEVLNVTINLVTNG